MLRKRFFEEIERVANGQDPKAIIRDEQIKRAVPIQIGERDGSRAERFGD